MGDGVSRPKEAPIKIADQGYAYPAITIRRAGSTWTPCAPVNHKGVIADFTVEASVSAARNLVADEIRSIERHLYARVRGKLPKADIEISREIDRTGNFITIKARAVRSGICDRHSQHPGRP